MRLSAERQRSQGFTALEVLIATGMLVALTIVMIMVLSNSANSMRALSLQSQVQHDNRVALDAVRAAIAPSIAVNPLNANEQLVDVFTVEEGEFNLANDTNGKIGRASCREQGLSESADRARLQGSSETCTSETSRRTRRSHSYRSTRRCRHDRRTVRRRRTARYR